MGQIVTRAGKLLCCGLTEKNNKNKKSKVKNDHLTILVIGDKDVGKTTLIDNYLEEHTEISAKEESAPLSQSKNNDKLRIKNTNQLFIQDETSYSVGISIVEINGSLDMMEKQLRESYYNTADIVFIMYNIGKVDSLYHVEKVWYPEIVKAIGNNNQSKSNMQVVVVGVNPECRTEFEESEIYAPTGEDDENETLFKRNTMRKSIGKGQGERISQKLTHRNSTKQTRHFEVKKDRLKVIDFFSQVIKDYVMSRED